MSSDAYNPANPPWLQQEQAGRPQSPAPAAAPQQPAPQQPAPHQPMSQQPQPMQQAARPQPQYAPPPQQHPQAQPPQAQAVQYAAPRHPQFPAGWEAPSAPAQRGPHPRPQHEPQAAGRHGGSVNDLNVLRRAQRPPQSGWRKALYRLSGGSLNPGQSPADIAYGELVDRVNHPVRGDYRIAVLSLKGGVGKTTTTVGLGATFSTLRGDRVIAVDANPDLGTLSQRVPSQTNSTVRTLLEDPEIHRYSDVRAHTSQAPSRLEVLAGERDPAVSEAFSENDYRSVVKVLQSFYNIILTDCGTGLMHSAMNGALAMANSLVLVTSPAIDGARSASATLDWLDHHGYAELVKRTVVVVNSARRGASAIDLEQLKGLFLSRCRAVHIVPYDDHLAEGAEIDLELVGKKTRRAMLELAAIVADDFSSVTSGQVAARPS